MHKQTRFVRTLFGALLVTPVMAIQRWLHEGSEMAVECLPEVASEPAARRVRSLAKEPELKPPWQSNLRHRETRLYNQKRER